jgi:imidazole glycerol-phosphate synthase subunit HisH
VSRVAILNYGMGNLRSVEKALEHLGEEPFLAAGPQQAESADAVILPGVGAFPEAMRRIRELGLDRFLRDWVAGERPLLGICLGMQLLFGSSTELDGAEGLGILPGPVTALDAPGLKVPHMGWESLRWERDAEVAAGIDDGTPFYFVHTFAARPDDPGDVVATAEWGERFACVVERGRTWGAQFHPEKSSTAGLRLLGNFARSAATARAA